MTLRMGVLIFGGGLLVLALWLWAHPALGGVALLLAVYGLRIVGGLLIERSRYRPPVDRTRGDWRPTGERFVDPATGRLTEVRYNAETGQRDYVPIDKPGDSG